MENTRRLNLHTGIILKAKHTGFFPYNLHATCFIGVDKSQHIKSVREREVNLTMHRAEGGGVDIACICVKKYASGFSGANAPSLRTGQDLSGGRSCGALPPPCSCSSSSCCCGSWVSLRARVISGWE